MKRILVLFLVLIFITSITNFALPAEQKVIKLNAMGWVQAEWPLKELAAQYEKLHPDIKIVYEDVGIDLKSINS